MRRPTTLVALVAIVTTAAACAVDSPTRSTALPDASLATSAPAGGNKCAACLFGPLKLTRAAGEADTTWEFTIPAVAGPSYIAEVSGRTGPAGSVELNGVRLLSDDSYRSESLGVALVDTNVLRVTLAGRRARSVTLQLRPVEPVTLDSVIFASAPTLVINGPSIVYDALISNRTAVARSNLDTQGWIVQPGATRAAGGQVLYCGAAFGVLPPGQCLRAGNGLSASNTNAGNGTLVPGPALAIIQVRRQSADGLRVVDSAVVPVTLTNPQVHSVSVVPPDVYFASPGMQLQLVANVVTTGGAPTNVTWSSSNAITAVVSSTGVLTSIAKGAALITATSVFDPSKQGTSLVSVGVTPVSGVGMKVSPGLLDMTVGQTIRLAAQVLGDTGRVVWFSSNFVVAPVSSAGQVTAVSEGAALITAQSVVSPWKKASALISVGTTPALGNGVNVSPGFWRTPVGQSVQLAAQFVGDTGSVYWLSSNAAVAPVSAVGRATGVWPGTASIIAQSKADASKTATATISVVDFRFTLPSVPTLVSTGAILPAVNPLSTAVSAESCGPSGIYIPDFMRVDFSAGGQAIGTVSSPTMTENGITRCWTWRLMWTPGTAFGTGVQYLVARGLDALNRPVILGPNTMITITTP